ncbi:fucose 4-O-acetylase-like acetyltransferase [Bradyrhizobium sp. USDA 3686]|uniref:nodulation factor fucose acetyltransferase NolL n=1 Tax=Bradyrhizobium canariense TaxID=255045 RepID=UPI00195708C8|nr:nodulation factor fucose acetyltransferase NolL [Bradyrhizobium canariense]MBM7488043.1 fucose 4-O-acetylase-like acetyltransferase [Bradyrhizobium canariense]
MFDTLLPVTGTIVPSSRATKANDRDLSLDFAKGALIVLVIVGHLIQYVIYRDDGFWYSPYYKSIYMFHMPLFMAISGYLSFRSLVQKSFIGAVSDRAKQLLLPMLFWWALMETAKLAALWRATSPTSGLWELVDDLAGTYWFIWATLFSYLLLKIFTKLSHRSWAVSGSAILVALAPLTFSISPLIRFTYPFFCLGFLLADSRERWTSTSRNHKLLLIFFLSIVTCVSFLAWGKDTYVYNNLGVIHDFRSAKDVLLMFVGAAAASAIAIELLLQCWSFGHSNRIARFIAVELGQTTLLLYLVQGTVFRLMDFIQFGGFWDLTTRLIIAGVLGATIVAIALTVRSIVRGVPYLSQLVLGMPPRAGLPQAKPAMN